MSSLFSFKTLVVAAVIGAVSYAGNTNRGVLNSALSLKKHISLKNGQNETETTITGEVQMLESGSNEEFCTDSSEEDVTFVAEAVYDEVSVPAAVSAVNDFGLDLGVRQTIDAVRGDDVLKTIQEARAYFNDVVMVDRQYKSVRRICQNKHENCAFWALLGECEANPAYMKVNCAPVCQSCDLLDVEKRCPIDPEAVDALYPGDLDSMFERILANPDFQKYEPKAVSRPTLADGDTLDTADYKVGGPWMLVFENILSEEEAQRFIELGALEGYKRSEDVGKKQEDGSYSSVVNSGRTSTNAWCNGVCYSDPTARTVMDRISNITGIDEMNSEYLQLLRYEASQFYQTHSDYIPFQRNRPSGVRILTFYMYLNEVEEGGGTNFPHMDLTVTPKRGRAALWPSVYNQYPNKKDHRTDHQALPVKKGVKYGANAWLHMRDFKTPNGIGC